MRRILPLFLIMPALELALLIEVGSRIGTLPTFAIIMTTALVGAMLARMQGLGVLRSVQRDLGEGRMPTDALIDGVIVLVSAVLLLTPGLVSDFLGILGLLPPVRARMRRALWKRLERAVARGTLHVHTFVQRPEREPATHDADFRSLD